MQIKKIVIVGGGTAGWLAAGALSRNLKNKEIIVIEAPSIPIISVGESVTPHVQMFFDQELGLTKGPFAPVINRSEWMLKTGAIYKFGNRFQGWVTNDPNNFENFSFNYTTDVKELYKETSEIFDPIAHFSIKDGSCKTTDLMGQLQHNKTFYRFDRFFNSQHHYMEKNVSPFKDKEYLLNPLYSWAQHINAEKCGEYVRDHLALPNGVKHIAKKVNDIKTNNGNISSLILEDGTEITADFFIDATGLKKVLARKLEWKEKIYQDYAVDRAVVGQTDYTDPNSEMVNYTQSIAQPHGWQFKIGLYHRMGNGYCYSSNHISDEQAVEHFKHLTKNRRTEPRIIKWTPSRLEKFADGNLAVIGLSYGFYEPLEANSLFIIITGIKLVLEALAENEKNNTLNWDNHNKRIAYALDDIADFIRVHYTLSKRTDTDFWNDMRAIGVKLNDKDLLKQKYYDVRNSMPLAVDHWSQFPDYLWLEIAVAWGIDISDWFPEYGESISRISQCYFSNRERKHDIVSTYMQNNYEWLKENIFENLTPSEWENKYLK